MKTKLKKSMALLISAGICASMMASPVSAADVNFKLNEIAESERDAKLIKATYTDGDILDKAQIIDAKIDANADTYTYTDEDVKNGVKYFLWDSISGMKPLAPAGTISDAPPVNTEKPTATADPTEVPNPTDTPDPTAEYTVKIGEVTGGETGDVMIVKTPANTPAPTDTPEPTTVPEPTATPDPSSVLTFTFSGSGEISADIDFGNGLKFIGPNKSAYDKGANAADFGDNESGLTFANRIKFGGKSTWNTSRVFEFIPASAGTVKVYFANGGGSTVTDTRNCVIKQDGKADVSVPAVNGGTKAIATAEVAASTPVYIGGDNNIGVFGIVFTPNAAAANIAISTSSVAQADGEELVNELKAHAGDTVTVKARKAGDLEALKLTTSPEANITGPVSEDEANGAEYYTFTMPAADTTVNAAYEKNTLPKDEAWTAADEALNSVIFAAGDGKPFGPHNGLSGYGDWTKNGAALTYTHTDGTEYTLPHGWQAGTGGAERRNFHFTPKQACIVTVIYTAASGRPVYIAQGNVTNHLAEGVDGANDGHPAVITADIEDPSKGEVYVVGGSSNKQIYGIFADYYDPNVIVNQKVSGKINYTGSYDTANAKIVFKDTKDDTKYEVPFGADYTKELRQNRSYDISIEENGVLSDKLAVTLDTNSVEVAKKEKTHDINVVDIALTEVKGDVVVHEYTPNDGTTLDLNKVSLTFTDTSNPEYTYTVSVGGITDGKYKVTMMPGHTYTVTAESIDGYSLSALSGTYAMAPGDTQPFKNILITENLGEVAFTKTIEVGEGKQYTRINDAITAVKAMKDRPAGEDGRVTINIDPGKYIEQVIINTGYVTLKAADENNRPEINWYYGIGYKYYSAKDGYYNEDNAVQKTGKANVDRWGCSVHIDKNCPYVIMDNIKVINTFSCNVVPEEITDGVEPGVYGDVSGKPDRTVKDYDAMAQQAVERAAAIAIDSDHFEAYKCDFVSSQDTFYTNTIGSYIKDCYIEGGTDFIYGGSQVAFDGCTLAWHGYSDGERGGYLTACSDNGQSLGYLFNKCTVTNSTYFPNNKFAAGGWGRNWGGADCHVVFDDITIADNVKAPTGWTQMGGPLSESTIYVNKVHRANGDVITSGDFNPNGTMEDNKYELHDMYDYFNGWTPPHYDGKTPEKTEYTTTWYFGHSNGAPDYEYQGAGGEAIEIIGISDNPEQQKLVVNAVNGKFNNKDRTDEWCQINDGTILTVPVVNGSVITFGAYDDNATWSVNGSKFTRKGSYTYGGAAGTATVTVEKGGYTSYIKVVSPVNPTDATPVPQLTVTFDKGDTEAEGEVPAFETVEQGKTVTIPVNRTLYKENNTLTGWSDGNTTYKPGDTFAPSQSVTLTPVFTANELPYKGTVDFNAVKNSGAPSIFVGENKTGIFVVQDDNGNDLKMGIDTSDNGKFDNGNGSWIQINTNTKLTVPVSAGSVVTVGKTYYGTETYKINDSEFTGGQDTSNNITVNEAGTATITVTNGGYFTNITVTYPG